MRVRRQGVFTTIRSEGGIMPNDALQRIAEGDPELGGVDPEAYHLSPGERLNEAITRSWNGLVGAWAAFRDALAGVPEADPATTVTRERWLLPLFQELGYGRLQPARSLEVGGRSYPVSHLWGSLPIHLVGARISIDRRTRGVAGAAGQSPHGLVQEVLNRSPDHLYGFVSNGLVLRLLRDNTSLTRQAYVEFDLQTMMEGEVFSDFAALWLTCQESRFEGDRPEACWLERWREAAERHGTRALEGLRRGVEEAIVALGRGFLSHPNPELKAALRSGDLSSHDYYRQLLRLVYRLLFLFAAEDRGLLLDPTADAAGRERYERWYSTARLRRLAELRRGTRHTDLYRALRLVMRFLGEEGGAPTLALPALGSFLWSPEAAPHLDSSDIANANLLDAVRALAFMTDRGVRRTVDYKNLGTEELGSVYESLLGLHPEVNVDAPAFALGAAGGSERKTTGSYYTPPSLVQALLDSALDPVLDKAASAPDSEAAILGLTVCDPASGSGHFLVAAAHRIARRLAAVRTGDPQPAPEALRAALRDVIGRCIYAVDVNPMAVELCKVSLWMEALEPGRPLSFLDAHVKRGDSLLGTTPALVATGISDDTFKPIEGDDKAIARELKSRSRDERRLAERGGMQLTLDDALARLAKDLASSADRIEAAADRTLAGLREKEAAFREHAGSGAYQGAKLVADAWCAAFVQRKAKGESAITYGTFRTIAEDPSAVPPDLAERISALAEEFGFFQWHVEFPKVFRVPKDGEEPDNRQAGWSGGFDVVLGNPPWERIKLQEKEFFAQRRPEIARARIKADRERLIRALADEDPTLYREFRAALRRAEAESHLVRRSGRYPLCGRGDVNTYAVFAEAMRGLMSPIGRVGCIVPSAIGTDDTTKFFFTDLISRRSLTSFFEFENEGFFLGTGQGHMNRFCLLTLSGLDHPQPQAEFLFQGKDLADLGDPERRFTLTPDDFALLNPNTRTCPIFRTRRDAEITKGIYQRVPVLIDESRDKAGNPWGIQFLAMFHMSNDSGLFRTRTRLEAEGFDLDGNVYRRGSETYLPLYEAKMVYQFNHRFGDYSRVAGGERAHVLPPVPEELLCDPDYRSTPFYWVLLGEVEGRLKDKGWKHSWLLGWRDVTDARASARTVISTVIPQVGAGNNYPLGLPAHPPAAVACLASSLSSFALDYVARFKAGGLHLNFFIFEQLAVPPPSAYGAFCRWSSDTCLADWIVPRVLELTYTARDLEPFASDLGYDGPPFRWDPERRFLLRAELDAAFFHLYGISREDAGYILDTFPIVKRKDEARHGEYRTKRVILEVYDTMAEAAAIGQAYRTVLDPPPADPSVAHPPQGVATEARAYNALHR